MAQAISKKETTQTAVDWLVNQIGQNLEIDKDEANRIIQQAKQMEKEQIVNFGNDLLAQNDINYIGVPDLAEQYYNETFQ